MTTRLIRIVVAFAAVSLTVGCGVDSETLGSLREAVETIRQPVPAPRPIEATPVESPSTFEPPHPDRVDPFSFPQDEQTAEPSGEIVPSVTQVEVLGFAHVDEPRVLLRTQGIVSSLRVGQSANGVEVIAIESPRVQLRAGSVVWTASLFDQPQAKPN
jgi:hypothetical protein